MPRPTPVRTETGKTCLGCGEMKPWSEYRKRPDARDGHISRCHACRRLAVAANRLGYTQRTDEQAAADRARLRPDGLKTCRSCREARPLSAFYEVRRYPDGLTIDCRSCLTARNRRRHVAYWRSVGVCPDACAYCGVTEEEHGKPLEIEHIVALDNGGEDTYENTVPACDRCNRGVNGKHTRDVRAWFAEQHPERLPLLHVVRASAGRSPSTRRNP